MARYKRCGQQLSKWVKTWKNTPLRMILRRQCSPWRPSSALLTWDSTRERVGHRTREGRPSEGSHGRRGAAKRREGVVEVRSPGAWWGGGRLILLQLGGIRSVGTYVGCGGGGVGVGHRGILRPILHRRAFVLFALYAAHRLALPGQTQHQAVKFNASRLKNKASNSSLALMIHKWSERPREVQD